MREFLARVRVGIGSLLAAGMFLMILALFVSTPGSEPSLGAAARGQFVLRDIVLLGAALSSAGEALAASDLKESTNERRSSIRQAEIRNRTVSRRTYRRLPPN